jgi:hypothetical protein
MYTVNGQSFNSYLAAIDAAAKIGADVIQTDNGMRRWTPPAPVSKKAKRRYADHKNAHEAQQDVK